MYVTVKIIQKRQSEFIYNNEMKLKMYVSSINHTNHLPSYRKHPGMFKIKFIDETVLAKEKMMLFS